MNEQKKNYPLHPSHAEPMYMQISRDAFAAMSAELEELRKLVVPTDILKAEIDSLKRELDTYKSIMQGNKTTLDDVAEIKTLTSEVKALRDMNAKAQGEKAKLEEDNALLRNNNAELRKENEEMTDDRDHYYAELQKADKVISEFRDATRWRKCSEELPEEERQFLCLRQTGDIKILWWSKQLKSFAQYDITHWMPLPKAPEEK